MQGMDHDLRRACEDVIATCADSACKPLRTWISDRLTTKGASVTTGGTSLKQPQEASDAFREACHGDFRAVVTKMRLYLEDDRTVAVLLKHAQERIIDEYLEFRREVWSATAGAETPAGVLSEDAVRALLSGVCESDERIAGRSGASAS